MKRADNIAELIIARGVSAEQVVVIAHGGARTISSSPDTVNWNRRVELMVIQVDTGN